MSVSRPRASVSRCALVALTALVAGCGGAPRAATPSAAKPPLAAKPAPSAATPAAIEPPLTPLRTGTVAAIVEPEVEVEIEARLDVPPFELVQLSLPKLPADAARSGSGIDDVGRVAAGQVMLDSDPTSLAVIGPRSFETPRDPRRKIGRGLAPVRVAQVDSTAHVWIRRPKSDRPITGSLFVPAVRHWESGMLPGHRIPFHVAAGTGASVPKLRESDWARVVWTYFGSRPGPFFEFAASRLHERYFPEPRTPMTPSARPSEPDGDLARLMDTMTGRLSIQAALERDRTLYSALSHERPSVAVGALHVPRLSVHPWAELRKAVAGPSPVEPLASSTPAEFWYVRANGVERLLDLVEVVDDWGQPAADVLDGHVVERGTTARYETELGLRRTGLARVLGPELVSEVAIVGSDPYVHEGTDLTVLFRVKSATLFRAALGGMLALAAAPHGSLTQAAFAHEGVTVAVSRSADGRVRQYRASVGDVEIVSNSEGAIRRVLSTMVGKHGKLSEQADFDYMLARDAKAKSDVLAYLGDAFVASVVGPKQKIAEARRQLALAELSRPGYAALLAGFLDGKSPASTDELVRAKWLDRADLRHADGAPIAFQPGHAATSRWGTPAALEPLIDLPEVQRVTRSEQAGYEQFSREYEWRWSDKIDPVALRITTTDGGRALSADLRVLPLLRNDYRDMLRMVGQASLSVPGIASGARLVMGIGKDASLRRELTQTGHSFGAGDKIAFDWIGDYALVGVANRNELANAAHVALSDAIDRPEVGAPEARAREDFPALLQDLPVYAAIGVRSRLGAAVTLTAVREMARDAAPGAAEWSKAPPHRGNEVVRVAVHEREATVSLYYALLPDALVLALSEAALHVAIDQLVDAPPTGVARDAVLPAADVAQVALELAGDPKGAVHRIAAWLATEALLEGDSVGQGIALATWRGRPELRASPDGAADAMRALFGVVPLTAEGQAYVLGADGLRDPLRGSAYEPAWPDLPAPGSPVERVLSRLARLRTALSFDDEPGSTREAPAQSLHARVTVELHAR